jgi:hypothetical protein
MRLLLSGLLLVTTGAVLPFLMATRMIEPSIPLSLLSYAASLSGLALGIGVLVSRASSHYPQLSGRRRTRRHRHLGIDPQRGPQ